MEEEANQLYRRPQMTGQARGEVEDIVSKIMFIIKKKDVTEFCISTVGVLLSTQILNPALYIFTNTDMCIPYMKQHSLDIKFVTRFHQGCMRYDCWIRN